MVATPQHYAPEVARPARGDPTMRKDVDIMGVQRGAHKDGPDVCPQYIFHTPGGTNEDGTKLWGWNDVRGAFCARCGARDIDHVVLRDFTKEAMDTEAKKGQARGSLLGDAQRRTATPRAPAYPIGDAPSSGDATALNPDAAISATSAAASARARSIEPRADPMQLYELEPGIPDPLAINAYRDAQKVRAEQAEKARAEAAAKAAAEAAANPPAAAPPASSSAESSDENERFKAEVERMVREQLAKEKLDALAGKGGENGAGGAGGGAGAAASVLSVSAMLTSIGLPQYVQAFEDEGIEMSVLLALATSEDGKAAVDEALKEVGVKSIGHRLKIFAALQQ